MGSSYRTGFLVGTFLFLFFNNQLLKSPSLFKFRNACRPPSSYRFVRSVNYTSLAHSVGSLPAINFLLRLPVRQHPGATHKPRSGSCQPSLLFPPHKAHASPVNRCSSFVVSKQSCQTITAAAINLFINFYGIAAPAMPFGCSASLRSLSCCLQLLLIPHGSYCVLHATSFISSFIPLHYTSFAAIHLLQGRASPAKSQKLCTKGMHQPFASHPYNTHWAPFHFTSSYIHFSSVQSTRCP